jgi:hypothetical protein
MTYQEARMPENLETSMSAHDASSWQYALDDRDQLPEVDPALEKAFPLGGAAELTKSYRPALERLIERQQHHSV